MGVAPGRDPAETGELRHLHRGEVTARFLQDAGHELERRSRESLRQGLLGATMAEDVVERVDGMLVRLRGFLQALHHVRTPGSGVPDNGSRTVNNAPPWLRTVTSPPRRAATCLTSARPSPRREPGPASFVV